METIRLLVRDENIDGSNVVPVRAFTDRAEADFVEAILANDPATTLRFIDIPVGLEFVTFPHALATE